MDSMALSTAETKRSPSPGLASSYSSAALLSSASAWRSRRSRLSAGAVGTTLGQALAHVGPLDQLGGAVVDFATPAIDLIEPGLLDLLAGEAAVQAGGQLLDQELALGRPQLQRSLEDLSHRHRLKCTRMSSERQHAVVGTGFHSGDSCVRGLARRVRLAPSQSVCTRRNRAWVLS